MDKLKKVMRRDNDEKTEEAGILEVKSFILFFLNFICIAELTFQSYFTTT